MTQETEPLQRNRGQSSASFHWSNLLKNVCLIQTEQGKRREGIWEQSQPTRWKSDLGGFKRNWGIRNRSFKCAVIRAVWCFSANFVLLVLVHSWDFQETDSKKLTITKLHFELFFSKRNSFSPNEIPSSFSAEIYNLLANLWFLFFQNTDEDNK